ncbi:MAG: hypothetical protein LC649_08355 [Bacteroidales bacterium]|nr:hypothetical protein [Bacteroidales bacterium]
MNTKELDRLLDLFYSGNASSVEEKRLSDLLSRDDIPDEYHPDRDFILTIKRGEEIPEPSGDMEFRIRERIGIEERRDIWRTRSKRLYVWVAAAASLLIAFSSYLIVRSGGDSNLTLAETEMVSQRAFSTINAVSAGMSEGKSAILPISHISEAERHLSVMKVAGNSAMDGLSQLNYMKISLDDIINQGDDKTKK